MQLHIPNSQQLVSNASKPPPGATPHRLPGARPLTILADTPTPWAMNIAQTDTTIEHRCEALTISEIPPYRCTTSATGARQRPGGLCKPCQHASRPLVR
jgi:hypothetical protein